MAVLLVASAALLVVGVAVERSRGDVHTETQAPVAHDESGEGSEAHERAEAHPAEQPAHDEASETAAAHADEPSTRLLGIDTESTPLVAVVVAVLLAAGVMWRPSWALIAVAVVFAVVAAVLDASEIAHQLDEDRVGIAVLAALVLLLHAGIVASGALAWRSAEPVPA